MPRPRTDVKPPDKGSFPLDHDGECKEFMSAYMKCLKRHGHDISACRHESKEYLGCRMEKNLMQKEDWSRLGYADLDNKTDDKNKR